MFSGFFISLKVIFPTEDYDKIYERCLHSYMIFSFFNSSNPDYLDIATNCGVQQIVITPTRREPILNISSSLRSIRSLLINTRLPKELAIMTWCQSTYLINYNKKTNWTEIYLWDNDNLSTLKEDITLFVSVFVAQPSHYMDSCWTTFRDKVQSFVERHITQTHMLTTYQSMDESRNTQTRKTLIPRF